MQNGDTIQYTVGCLGTMRHDEATKFEDRVVNEGELGLYVGPHPNPRLAADDWHLTLVKDGEGALFVPVHSGQFAAA